MWPESSSVSIANLAKKFTIILEISKSFSQRFTFLAHPVLYVYCSVFSNLLVFVSRKEIDRRRMHSVTYHGVMVVYRAATTVYSWN